MSLIRRLDHWIGTRLFHPPIIWSCQRTGMTQHAIARYAWMAATLTFVARIGSGPHSTGTGYVIFAIVSGLVITLGTAILANWPTWPFFPMRILLWTIGLLQVAAILRWRHVTTEQYWEICWELFALTAEYAKTIDTVPPVSRRERRARSFARQVTRRTPIV